MFGGLVVSRGDSVNPGLIGAVLGFVLGHVIGSRQRTTICSDPVCGALLQPGDARCARCGGKIAGELAHANDRLDAEER